MLIHKKDINKTLPPVIRVFISSTFADMNRERHYFNTVIVPQLTRLCSERGVSFFSVDLRWGITEEDQINGNVIPICLREIDNCRPFFIGIIGNRYGSILNNVTFETKASFPWLNEHLRKSVTELEILYGVLRQAVDDNIPNCAFYFRSNELSDEFFPAVESDEKLQKLAVLKATIRQNTHIPSFDYHSLEQFGQEVISAVSTWLDKEFPSRGSVHDIRKKWYSSELLRDYVRQEEIHNFFDNYCGSTNRSLIITGKGQRGKTTALTAWIPENGEKILINCGADSEYQYWPAIAHDIVVSLRKIDGNIGKPKFNAYNSQYFRNMERKQRRQDNNKNPEHSMYFITDKEQESFRHGFVFWLKTIKPCLPVYIIINDLNLLGDINAAYLTWLPAETKENVHLIISANDDTIIENAKALGWNIKEMPLFSKQNAGAFLDRYMRIFGKNMTAAQKENLLKSPLLQYPGYLKHVIRFFNNYGNFENLDHLTNIIGQVTSEKELYSFVLNHLLNDLSPQEALAAQTTLFFLSVTSLGLHEDDLYAMVQETSPVDAIGWSRIRVILEQFQIVTADAWKIWDNTLRDIVQDFNMNQQRIHCRLGKFFLERVDKSISLNAVGIKHSTDCAKAALYHFGEAKDWETLSELLLDRVMLYYMSKMEWNTIRSSWLLLLVFSDADVSEKLAQIVKRCNKDYADINGIKTKIIALLSDLEMWDIAHDASIRFKLPELSELRSLDQTRFFSEETRHTFNRLSELYNNNQFDILLSEAKKFLEMNEEKLNNIEKCFFYKLKVICEEELKDIDSGIETSYKYYVAAIASMDNYEILNAVRHRGRLLYSSERYTEAQKVFSYCQKLALNLGDIRDYLASTNAIGMCAYRQEHFNEAITAFETCIKAWDRLGNNEEVINCRVNKSNALFLSGDVHGAIDDTERLIDFIDSLEEEMYSLLCVNTLGNLGSYYANLNQMDKAEEAYLRAIDISKDTGNLNTNNYRGLITIYRNQQQIAKAIQICEELIEQLHHRERYNELAEAVKDCMYLMQNGHYDHKANTFKKKWQAVFERISGGHELLRDTLSEHVDPLLEDNLRGELVVAQSEKDEGKSGEILQRLASQAMSRGDKQACDLYIQAMEAFIKAVNEINSNECACYAVRLLINSGFEDIRFGKIYAMFSQKDRLIIDEWLAIRKVPVSDETYAEGINRILNLSKQHTPITAYCLLDETRHLIDRLPKEILCRAAEWMNQDQLYQAFDEAVYSVLADDATNKISFLRQNYIGTRADKMLVFFEKVIALLEVMNSIDAGALAGNIAMIYRRRRDKAETIRYHEKAINIYRDGNLTRDVYIELMNLATAYKEFNCIEEAIELLRNTLKESELSSCEDIQAAIAGNLAAFLIEYLETHDDSDCDNEITTCFGIEEAYFEKSMEMRELAISLINQIKYALGKRQQNTDVIKDKFSKLEQIVALYELDDFIEIIRKLKLRIFPVLASEPGISPKPKPRKWFHFFWKKEKNEENIGNANRLLNELIKSEGNYKIISTDEETNSHIHGLCHPKKSIPLVKVNLHVWISIPANFRLKFSFVMKPQDIYDKIQIFMKQHAEWWSEKNDYELRFHEEDNRELVLTVDDIEADNWNEITETFKRVAIFWTSDVLREIKLKLL